jgi:hypothetical protein
MSKDQVRFGHLYFLLKKQNKFFSRWPEVGEARSSIDQDSKAIKAEEKIPSKFAFYLNPRYTVIRKNIPQNLTKKALACKNITAFWGCFPLFVYLSRYEVLH